MPLTGKQVSQFRDALLDSYQSADELRMMVRIELGENLNAIAGGENQRVLAFNLVSWAEQAGRVNELLECASRHNPGNQTLQQLVTEWRAQTLSHTEQERPSSSDSNRTPTGPVSIDVFLSYSRKDSQAMTQVREALRTAGLSVWTDDGLEPGTPSWQNAITEAVRQASAMVVLLSPNSNASTWVHNEIVYAQTLRKRIIPVLISGDETTAVPIGLIAAQRVDGREEGLSDVVTARLLLLLGVTHSPATPDVAPRARPPREAVAPPSSAKSRAATPLFQAGADINPRKSYRGLALTVVAAVVVGMFAYYLIERYLLDTSAITDTSAPATSEPTAGEVREFKGVPFVYVPAGEFTMGSNPNTDSMALADEQPQHTLTLPGFWIMRTEVTNGQYKRCVEEGVCTEPNNTKWKEPVNTEHPVTDVTWRQANEYAAWAGGRLPTEAEWEKACRGTDAQIYPWGDTKPTAELANFGLTVGNTTSVGTYSPQGDSPYGVADMAGNIWEWTSSQYQPYPFNAVDGPENPAGDASRTLRGGAWNFGVDLVRCAYRGWDNPGYGSNRKGFRILSPGS